MSAKILQQVGERGEGIARLPQRSDETRQRLHDPSARPRHAVGVVEVEDGPRLHSFPHSLHLQRRSGGPAALGLHGYPGIGESVMVGRDLQIARFEGAPLHLCHISAAESVAEIRRAKELGVEVTAEVSPHHLCLTDELVRELDPAVSKINPPLRSAADRAALIEALADGTLDCVATDHAPHRTEEKEVPFEAAANGVIGLETAFAALYTHLVAPGLVPLSTLVERMSAGPARAFALPVPAIRVGEVANLALWNLGESWLVAPPYASRSRNCAFAGQTLLGRCTMTIADGAIAHRMVEVAR